MEPQVHKIEIQIKYLLIKYHKEIYFKILFGVNVTLPFTKDKTDLHINECFHYFDHFV